MHGAYIALSSHCPFSRSRLISPCDIHVFQPPNLLACVAAGTAFRAQSTARTTCISAAWKWSPPCTTRMPAAFSRSSCSSCIAGKAWIFIGGTTCCVRPNISTAKWWVAVQDTRHSREGTWFLRVVHHRGSVSFSSRPLLALLASFIPATTLFARAYCNIDDVGVPHRFK